MIQSCLAPRVSLVTIWGCKQIKQSIKGFNHCKKPQLDTVIGAMIEADNND